MKFINRLASRIVDGMKEHENLELECKIDNLERQLDAKNYTINEVDKKNEMLKADNEELNGKLFDASQANRQLLLENKRVENNYKEVKAKLETAKGKPNAEIKVLKERCSELNELAKTYEEIAKNNAMYVNVYQYISEDKNKSSVKEVFSHNLELYLKETNMNYAEAGRFFGINRATLRDLVVKRSGLTVSALQKVDLLMCEYFECSVYELVTEKMEGKK